MKFAELHLELAVSRAGMSGDPVTDEQRRQLAVAVMKTWVDLFGDSFFSFTLEEVAQAAVRVRKRGKSKVAAWQIAEAHNQWDCFWKNRNKGPCSDEVEAGHVVARAHGGGDLTIENGMIECRAHNNQRRTRTIEQYMDSDDCTECKAYPAHAQLPTTGITCFTAGEEQG
jgi:hypothetical protein